MHLPHQLLVAREVIDHQGACLAVQERLGMPPSAALAGVLHHSFHILVPPSAVSPYLSLVHLAVPHTGGLENLHRGLIVMDDRLSQHL